MALKRTPRRQPAEPPDLMAAIPARPRPPEALLHPWGAPLFVPDAHAAIWLKRAFIAPDSPAANPQHEHLQWARIGFLWTNVANRRQQMRVIGQAEMPRSYRAPTWQKARMEQQLLEWFGELPDFVITIDAGWSAQASDREFCAVAEHELSHCAQDVDPFGMPKFNASGMPAYALKGHDCEEFVNVVQRYGVVSDGVRRLVDAAKGAEARGPAIGDNLIGAICGSCAR